MVMTDIDWKHHKYFDPQNSLWLGEINGLDWLEKHCLI